MVKEEGWNAYGCDVNVNFVRENQKEFGDSVRVQVGDQIPYGDKYFDVVTIFDTLEHLPNPLVILEELARILKDDGVLVVSTPNVDGVFAKITYRLLCQTLKIWEHPTPPEHLYEFSMKTLSRALEVTGFRCVHSKSFETHIPYTVGKLESSLAEAMRKPKSEKENVLKSWCKENPKTKNADAPLYTRFAAKFKKLSRLVFRACAYGFVTSVFVIGRQLKAGNSMILVGKKTVPDPRQMPTV
jgi:ubiquinone/menaquinone biosynthesis C-methylase UbiE